MLLLSNLINFNNEVRINNSSFVLNDIVILLLSLNLLRILVIFCKK